MPFKINLVSEEVDKFKQHFSSPQEGSEYKASEDLKRECALEEELKRMCVGGGTG